MRPIFFDLQVATTFAKDALKPPQWKRLSRCLKGNAFTFLRQPAQVDFYNTPLSSVLGINIWSNTRPYLTRRLT